MLPDIPFRLHQIPHDPADIIGNGFFLHTDRKRREPDGHAERKQDLSPNREQNRNRKHTAQDRQIPETPHPQFRPAFQMRGIPVHPLFESVRGPSRFFSHPFPLSLFRQCARIPVIRTKLIVDCIIVRILARMPVSIPNCCATRGTSVAAISNPRPDSADTCQVSSPR